MGSLDAYVAERPRDKCKLLFLGVDWARKGGDIVIQVAQKLNEKGLNTELTIVGCEPNFHPKKPDFVKVVGFISKKTNQGIGRINEYFVQNHFLMLPSLAECSPVVFSEANSFGVPCISTDTGGIPTIIKNGKNGKLFSIDAAVDEYVDYIQNLFSNYLRYSNLAFAAFNEYKTRLNWSVSGKKLKKLLEEVLT